MKNGLKALSYFFIVNFAASCGPSFKGAEADAPEPPAVKFDSGEAWDEFESYFDLFYAYSDKMDFDVKQAKEAVRTRVLSTTSKAEFREELVKFGQIFADPHIIFGPLTESDFNVVPTSSDSRVQFDGKNYVIADVCAESPADEAEIRPGFILVDVNQTPIEALVSDLFAGLVDSPTARQKSHAATLIANGKRSGLRLLKFEGGKTMDLDNPRDFAIALSEKPILSVSYDDDIAIIRFHNSLGNNDNDTIEAFDAAMRETPSGGNTEVGRSIIGHFVTEARPFQVHTVPSLEREFSVPRQFTEYVMPRLPHRSAKETVALGSYWTGSMGEGVLIGLDGAADMYVIASDMGDLLGGLSNFDLEHSSIRLDLPFETISHIDGTPREDFVADLALNSSDRDELGSDPAMEAAVSYFRSTQKAQ